MHVPALVAPILTAAMPPGWIHPVVMATTADQRSVVQMATRLRPWLNAADAEAVTMALILPVDQQFSPAQAEQLVPGWQSVPQQQAARVSHFQIEPADSPVYKAMTAAGKRLGRPLNDPEQQPLPDDDRGGWMRCCGLNVVRCRWNCRKEWSLVSS